MMTPKNDFISFNTLLKTVRREYLLLIVIIISTTLLASVLALALPKTYRSKCELYPPGPEDVQEINVWETYRISANDLLLETFKNINDTQLRLELFEEIYEKYAKNSASESGEGLGKNMVYELHKNVKNKLIYNRRNDQMSVTVVLEGKYPDLLFRWLEDYMGLINQYTAQKFKSGLETVLVKNVEDFERQISVVRKYDEVRISDAIIRLEEAALLAEKVGIEGPMVSLTGINNTEPVDHLSEGSEIHYDMNMNYLHGIEALRAQIDLLKQRKEVAPYSKKIRRLEEKILLLQSYDTADIDFDASVISMAQSGKVTRIGPSALMLVVVGVLLGFLMSLIVVLIKCK